MKTLQQKKQELENDKELVERFNRMGFTLQPSAYIPFKVKNHNLKYEEKILEPDTSKWMFDHDDMEEYFQKFFKENLKPDYDGVYYVASVNDDYTYNKDHSENQYISADRIRRNYLLKKYREEHKAEDGWNENPIEFTIKCKMKHRWADEFVSFLRYLESNGNVGHSSAVSFFADGDGDFRPTFEVSDKSIVDDLAPCFLDKNDSVAECLFDAG